MTATILTLAIAVAATLSCTPPKPIPSRPLIEVQASIEKCESSECRLTGYLELFKGGTDLLSKIRDADAPCGAFRAPGCAAVPFCLSLLQGTYQTDFHEESDVVWLGRNAAAVKEVTRVAESSLTQDGMLDGDPVAKRVQHFDLASITLSRDASRWREVPFVDLTVTRRVQDVVPIENCTVVFADACAGRVGYVCAGRPWWNAAGRGGWIAVELDLESPPKRRLLAPGKAAAARQQIITLD